MALSEARPRGHRLYPTLVGLFLGLVQTGLFIQLSFTLSSSIGTYLMVTLCWLAGSATAALWLEWRVPGLTRWLMLSLAAYGAVVALLALAPFQTTWWPLYAAFVTVIGVFPGLFFARMAPFYRARTLFFLENNGFILGLASGTLLFMAVGRAALWVGPVVVAAALWNLTPGPSPNPNDRISRGKADLGATSTGSTEVPPL